MSNETRRQIIETTSDLLERQGYHATGLKQIVKESGAPRGSLYYYFPDGKEEMASVAVERKAQMMADHTRAILDEYDDPAEAVHGFVLRLAEKFRVTNYCGGAPLTAVALETCSNSERLRDTCVSAYGVLHQPFFDKLVAGGFDPDRAERLTTLVAASIEGAIVLARTRRDAGPLESVATELRAMLEHVRAEYSI